MILKQRNDGYFTMKNLSTDELDLIHSYLMNTRLGSGYNADVAAALLNDFDNYNLVYEPKDFEIHVSTSNGNPELLVDV